MGKFIFLNGAIIQANSNTQEKVIDKANNSPFNSYRFSIQGRLSSLTPLPTTGLAQEIVLTDNILSSFRATRKTPGSIGTTTIQLEKNGLAVSGAILSWETSDSTNSLKETTLNLEVDPNDILSLRVLSTELNAIDLQALVY